MALGVYGFGCEDALIHLLNHVWPNIFETSPHLVQAFMDSIEGMRVALGPIKILQYTLQVCNSLKRECLLILCHQFISCIFMLFMGYFVFGRSEVKV